MIVIFVFYFSTLISSLLHLFISKHPVTINRIIEIFLRYMLLIIVGLGSIWAFMGHAFLPDKIAAYIGWSAGSPFQFEVAFANLSFGLLGIIAFRFTVEFWSASVIAVSVFYWGAAYGHITDMIKHHNYAPGNTGAPVYLDIILPLVLIALLLAYIYTSKKSKKKPS